MYCYDTITKETTARRLIDVWFKRNERAEESMWTLIDSMATWGNFDIANDAAYEYAHIAYLYYGVRACKALEISVENLYYAVTQRFGLIP